MGGRTMDKTTQDCRAIVLGNWSTEFWAADLYMRVDGYRARHIQGYCSCVRLSAEFKDDYWSWNKGFVHFPLRVTFH